MTFDHQQELVALGMTKREAEIYYALLGKPEWKAVEIQQVTGISRVQIHLLLSQMLSLNYCMRRTEGRFQYYRATPPDILLDMLNERWENDLYEKQQKAGSIRSQLTDLFKSHSSENKTLDFIEIIQTPSRIHKRFVDLMSNAKDEILGISRSPYSFVNSRQSTKLSNEQQNANEDAIKHLSHARNITMYEPEYWKYIKEDVELSIDSNYKVRMIDDIPIKMIIFDRKIAYMTFRILPSKHKSSMNVIILHELDIIDAFIDLFEHYWEKSMPYEEWCKTHPEV